MWEWQRQEPQRRGERRESVPGTIVPGRSPRGDDWPFVPQTPSPASGVLASVEGGSG